MTPLRLLPLLVLAGPAAVLGAALLSQYVGGLNPCPMCIWQRWPHAIAIALALAALIAGRRAGLLYPVIALILLVGTGIGASRSGPPSGPSPARRVGSDGIVCSSVLRTCGAGCA